MFNEKINKPEPLSTGFPLKAESDVTGTTAATTSSATKENLKIHIPTLSKRKRERPAALLSNAPESVVQNGKLTETAIYILHTMSGVDIDLLKNVVIKIKPIGEFPFYNPWKGGGAITIGSSISLTENYFDRTSYYFYDVSTYTDKYGNETLEPDDVYANSSHRIYTSYGEKPMVWLELLSHEVRHLVQAQAFGTDEKGIKKYKRFFAGQYIKYLGHNRVPFEKTADEGSYTFGKIVVDPSGQQFSSIGQKMEMILNNKKLSDADKKKMMEALLGSKTTDEAIKKIRQEYESAHPKKFKKEEKQKEKAEEKRDERLYGGIDLFDYDILDLEDFLNELQNDKD